MEINKCPYCKKKLEKIPLRKSKCKFCGHFIYVRTLPPKMNKVLIKGEEIKKVENSWIDYLFNSYWMKELKKFGTSKKDVERIYYTLKERFGTTPLIADIMWGVFNNSILDSMKKGNKKEIDKIQALMDKFKEKESKGEELWDF
ncbi:hypothetical protein COU58_01020 [Candidatus Pacearchaeota archaeon CG10_big_fil_rev_8_21_14_0_10_32_42]|nr:MAG: hypothetical protein COU58_01020 [Candidatus Pacearchaeota archaeon CG10_big_fil_rev_8_21_14_0_10_32_42]